MNRDCKKGHKYADGGIASGIVIKGPAATTHIDYKKSGPSKEAGGNRNLWTNGFADGGSVVSIKAKPAPKPAPKPVAKAAPPKPKPFANGGKVKKFANGGIEGESSSGWVQEEQEKLRNRNATLADPRNEEPGYEAAVVAPLASPGQADQDLADMAAASRRPAPVSAKDYPDFGEDAPASKNIVGDYKEPGDKAGAKAGTAAAFKAAAKKAANEIANSDTPIPAGSKPGASGVAIPSERGAFEGYDAHRMRVRAESGERLPDYAPAEPAAPTFADRQRAAERRRAAAEDARGLSEAKAALRERNRGAAAPSKSAPPSPIPPPTGSFADRQRAAEKRRREAEEARNKKD